MATSFIRSIRLQLPSLNRNYQPLPASPQASIHSLDSDVELGSTPCSDENGGGWSAVTRRRPITCALLQLAIVFCVGSLILGGTLWLAIPPLDEADRLLLHVPKSFDELKALDTLLRKIKTIYPYRTVICFIVTYLYLQAFSLPGSMYLSILAGAVWGVSFALPLCCLCVATGASICYLISACFGPALFALPKLKCKIDGVARRVGEPGHRENLIPYMIVLRMAPLPPHWAINVACPHLSIGIIPFYISAFLGIAGVTTIHTTIGGGLEQMTSSDDFHLISWTNALGLGAVILAVCVPIVLRWKWQKELDEPTPEMTCDEMPSTREMRTIPSIVFTSVDDDHGNGTLGLAGMPSRNLGRR